MLLTSSQPDLSPSQTQELKQILSQFSNIFSTKPGNTQLADFFSTETTPESPITLKPYKIPIGLEEQCQLRNLIEDGIIESSNSEWAFPAIPVRKKDGGIRIVIDYRKLNAVTRKLPFYMPTIEEVIGKLGKARYFSKVDLTKGFHQIPISQESMDKTSFVASFGKFRYRQLD